MPVSRRDALSREPSAKDWYALYSPNAKGNFPRLAKLATNVPFFHASITSVQCSISTILQNL